MSDESTAYRRGLLILVNWLTVFLIVLGVGTAVTYGHLHRAPAPAEVDLPPITLSEIDPVQGIVIGSMPAPYDSPKAAPATSSSRVIRVRSPARKVAPRRPARVIPFTPGGAGG